MLLAPQRILIPLHYTAVDLKDVIQLEVSEETFVLLVLSWGAFQAQPHWSTALLQSRKLWIWTSSSPPAGRSFCMNPNADRTWTLGFHYRRHRIARGIFYSPRGPVTPGKSLKTAWWKNPGGGPSISRGTLVLVRLLWIGTSKRRREWGVTWRAPVYSRSTWRLMSQWQGWMRGWETAHSWENKLHFMLTCVQIHQIQTLQFQHTSQMIFRNT